jgi:hypothetical protein
MSEYKCDKCSKIYKYRQNLYRHRKSVHISDNDDETIEELTNETPCNPNVTHLSPSNAYHVTHLSPKCNPLFGA